jgi:hypothetical protein
MPAAADMIMKWRLVRPPVDAAVGVKSNSLSGNAIRLADHG